MKSFTLVVASLLLILVLPAVVRPQGAVRCMCYCGTYLYPPCSEEACKAACNWNQGGGRGGQGGGGSEQIYYCRAVAPSGAWGWAYSWRESEARQNAIAGCRKHADGCAIEACAINDPSLAQPPPASPGPRPAPPQQGQTTPETEWCDLCVRKLQADIDSGWASGLIRVYVGQAIAGYENCKLKARGICPAGDRMAKRLRDCSPLMFDRYRACLTDATELK